MNSDEVIRRLGITYRQLNNWVAVGYVETMSGGGTGNRFEFSSKEFVIIERMANLVKAGVKPEVAAKAARSDGDVVANLLQAVNACVLPVGPGGHTIARKIPHPRAEEDR